MLKNTMNHWKTHIFQKGTTLQRRLILLFISVTVCLILSFTLLLMLFGINGTEANTVYTYLNNELDHISTAIYTDFGHLSVDGLNMAAEISKSCDTLFSSNKITAGELADNPDFIQPLLADQMQTLLSAVNGHSCGGVFLLLDATVQPKVENAADFKAGIFLKKTQPTTTQSVDPKIYYLRGPAQIAREHGVELLGQWSMEYDISEESFFLSVMENARANTLLPLSRLYYWTERVTLKNNSEAGFLLCIPLRSEDGTVFGVCGIEVSDRMFKQLYSPSDSTYQNVFTIAAPSLEDSLLASRGMIAGNYYLTANYIQEDLTCSAKKNGFKCFANNSSVYGGGSVSLRLYPYGSPYEEESWSVAIMMPEVLLDAAITGNLWQFMGIVFILFIICLAVSILISNRYVRPVTDAFISIRNSNYEEMQNTTYLEISDLFDYLAEKNRDHEEERHKLELRRQEAMADANSAQTKLSRLADKRRKEVDPDAYAMFLANLISLTPKEREILNLYLAGKSAKEIMELIHISENTLKYHNKNIYSKLGVSSRKELLLYSTLRQYK